MDLQWLGEEAWADERQTPLGQFFRVLLLARGELGGGGSCKHSEYIWPP